MKWITPVWVVFFLCFSARAVIYGSLTAVSRQALITLPANDATNELRGFGAFENGFTLTNASTACLFTSLFPVSGPISLNGGTLTLNQSMVLDSDADIKSAGIIVGNNYKLVLPAKMSSYTLPSTTLTWGLTLHSVKLCLQSDLVFNVPVIFQGTCEIQGNGYSLTLAHATGISIASGASLLMKDVIVKNVSGTKIGFAATSSFLKIQDVVWCLNGNTTLSTGYFNLIGNWYINGPYSLSYTSAQTSTILSNGQLCMGFGSTLNYAPSVSVQNLLLFSDATAKLLLHGATLSASTVGMQLTRGSLICDGKSYITSSGTTAATGISLGGASSGDDVTIEILPGASVEVAGFVGYKNFN